MTLAFTISINSFLLAKECPSVPAETQQVSFIRWNFVRNKDPKVLFMITNLDIQTPFAVFTSFAPPEVASKDKVLTEQDNFLKKNLISARASES